MNPDFHVDTDPLPVGTVAIEASAGTGKTYTLSRLAARYVAEAGLSISQLLIVTFTNAAAAELRERVRRELHERSRRPETGPAERERLRRAVSEFDTATITTIHGFCRQVLTRLGVAAPGDPDDVMEADDDHLVRWVCADVLTAAAVAPAVDDGAPFPAPKLPALVSAVKMRLAHPNAQLAAAPTDEGYLLVELVEEAAHRIHEARRTVASYTYDQMISRVRDLVEQDEVVELLRHRFAVALIDEFQDTDAHQWHIFSRLFGAGGDGRPDGGTSALVLVGDPKQAIYSFRGADIHTYLEAVQTATVRRRLGTNHRSTRSMVTAMNALLAGGAFGVDATGAPAIPYEPVDVPAGAPVGDPDPLELRVVPSEVARDRADGTRRLILNDLVARVAAFLDAGRPPDDIAVLVRSNGDAARVLGALSRGGIPAVLARAGDVFDSPAAGEWRRLLAALDRPSRPDVARAAAFGWFLGAGPDEAVHGDDDWLAGIQQRLADLAHVLRSRGVRALYASLLAGTDGEGGPVAALLSTPDGERNLTDAEHIAELLHAGTGGSGCVPATLIEVLEAGVANRSEDDETAKRRVDVDSGAVRIATIHTAKGLEYPIVLSPFLGMGKSSAPYLVRTAEESVIVLGPSSKETSGFKEFHAVECHAEALRLLYVAYTRAKERLVVWWCPSGGAKVGKDPEVRRLAGPLAHVLWARGEGEAGGLLDPHLMVEPKVQADTRFDPLIEQLRPVLDAAGGTITVTELPAEVERAPRRFADTSEQHSALEVAAWPREADGPLPDRWSFTRLTAADHHHTPVAEIEDVLADDEALPDPEPMEPAAAASFWDDVAGGGTSLGTLVHEALEVLDTSAEDVDAALAEAIVTAHGPEDPTALVRALRATLETPLGPALSDHRLLDIPRTDTLQELNFELPLGVDAPTTVAALADVLAEDASGIAPYRVEDFVGDAPADTLLTGVLNGSIDLVARVRHPEGAGMRWWVMDYKTNRLNATGGADPYHPDHLPAAMADHRYPLQALLYQVALHRYLRWRLRGYDPERDLGGSAYLFLRGMTGPEVTRAQDGTPAGVALWMPPASLIERVSRLLHVGVERSVA